jgi:hypothetical protein
MGASGEVAGILFGNRASGGAERRRVWVLGLWGMPLGYGDQRRVVATKTTVCFSGSRHFSSLPTMSDETYDAARARNLEALLRDLAARIQELDRQGLLLDQAGELMRLIGDVRSELFHYEVRATYDTPEIAESRRIVREAKEDEDPTWHKSEWTPDEDESPEW